MIVRSTRWQNKMDILTYGREGLRKQNIKVDVGALRVTDKGGFLLTTVAASWLSWDLFVLHPTQLSTTQTRAGETGIAEIRSKVKTALIGTGSNCSSNTAPTPSTAMTGKLPIV